MINGGVVENVVALRIQRSRRGPSDEEVGCVYGGWNSGNGSTGTAIVSTGPL